MMHLLHSLTMSMRSCRRSCRPLVVEPSELQLGDPVAVLAPLLEFELPAAILPVALLLQVNSRC